jgi:hypothetical protein
MAVRRIERFKKAKIYLCLLKKKHNKSNNFTTQFPKQICDCVLKLTTIHRLILCYNVSEKTVLKCKNRNNFKGKSALLQTIKYAVSAL